MAGQVPQRSGDETRQAADDEAEDRLVGRARRQVNLDLRLHFDDAGGDLDEA